MEVYPYMMILLMVTGTWFFDFSRDWNHQPVMDCFCCCWESCCESPTLLHGQLIRLRTHPSGVELSPAISATHHAQSPYAWLSARSNFARDGHSRWLFEGSAPAFSLAAAEPLHETLHSWRFAPEDRDPSAWQVKGREKFQHLIKQATGSGSADGVRLTMTKPLWTTLSGWWFGIWSWLSHILGMIIPIDFHIFQRGWNHQPVNQFR